MTGFCARSNLLHAEEVSLEAIAARVGTPTYVYCANTLRASARAFRAALAGVPRLKLVFAIKANPNLAVLQVLRTECYGADIVSGGELERALAAGIASRDIVFSGVGKTTGELLAALDARVGQFNIESEMEGVLLSGLASASGRRATVALRVNPDIDASTHAKITTGRRDSKFGIALNDVAGVAKRLAMLPGLNVRGLAVHIGSQLTDLVPLEAAYRSIGALLGRLRDEGLTLESVDLGGGLGVAYAPGDPSPDLAAYGAMVRRVTRDWDVSLTFEPGRLIVAEAGALLTRVTLVKPASPHPWVIVDAGMNDLMRPALYGARHRFVAVRRSGRSMVAAVAGPICESSDVFAEAGPIDEVAPGDLAIFATAGAYGAAMASAYNCRGIAAEVLVDGARSAIIADRVPPSDALRHQRTPYWLDLANHSAAAA